MHGTGYQDHLGACCCCCCCDRVALLPGRAVGDIANRIDRLMGRTGGDQHALACQRLVASPASRCAAASTISSGSAMRPVPASPLSAISPAFGPDQVRRRRPRAARYCGGSQDDATSSGSSPARSGSACRLRAAPRRRDRRHGRRPSLRSDRRWRARRSRYRCHARAGYDRRRIRSAGRTGR